MDAGRRLIDRHLHWVTVNRTIFGRPLRSVAFDVAVSGAVALFALAGVVTQPGGWKATLVGVAMAVALLFRRVHPSAVAAVVAVLALIQVIVGWGPLGYDIAVLIALYSVVKYADRLRDGVLAGIVAAVGVGLAAPQIEGDAVARGAGGAARPRRRRRGCGAGRAGSRPC